jgi:hypothetical protein
LNWHDKDPYLGLDPIDLVQLSLLAGTGGSPRAVVDALSWIIDNRKIPEAVEALDYVHQLGLFESLLKKSDCWSVVEESERKTIEILNGLREGIATALSLYAGQVGEVLQSTGVEHAFLKGLASSPLYYSAPYERPFKDIDVLVHRDAVERAYFAFTALGFLAGRLRHSDNKVEYLGDYIPNCSAEHYELPVLWREETIEEVEEIELIEKLIKERRVRGYVIRDRRLIMRIPAEIHYDAGILGDNSWQFHTIRLRDGTSIQSLVPEQHFAFSLYSGYLDICLGGKRYGSKLIADCWRQLQTSPEATNRVLQTCADIGLRAPAFYLLYHGKNLFRIPGVDDLLLRIKPDGKHWSREQYNFGDFLPRIFRNPKMFLARP